MILCVMVFRTSNYLNFSGSCHKSPHQRAVVIAFVQSLFEQITFKRPDFCTALARAICMPISASKFSGLAQALSPVTVKPLRSTRTQNVSRCNASGVASG